jgi:hypothetical protein
MSVTNMLRARGDNNGALTLCDPELGRDLIATIEYQFASTHRLLCE